MINEIYTHKQEVWDEKECAKRANYAPKDFWGNQPPKGLISHVGSVYPEYGQTTRWNGCREIEGKLYRYEHRPLPKIPKSYEIVPLISWGRVIRKKN